MAIKQYGIKTEVRQLKDLIPADYNPRKDLQPKDQEYKNIVNSLREFGYVDPIIVNKDGTIIGGHQRAKALQTLGRKEAEVVIVDVNKSDEMALNIALNKIGGSWEGEKLKEALGDLVLSPVDVNLTGFSDDELRIVLGDDEAENEQPETSIDRMTFKLSLEQYAELQEALDICKSKYKDAEMETFGNTNKVGNLLYMVVKEWAELKKLK